MIYSNSFIFIQSFSKFQLIMAQEDILIKEKQLETARKKLEIIRKAKYRDRPNEYDSTDSGTDF